MGVPYKLFYRLGFHPWEDLAEHPPFAEKLSELFAREESGREPPYGAALDLGGGSAVWAVPLAKRGWQVTSIDIVDNALERARERVREADVDVRVMHADATALREAEVGSDFRLVLDTGTFHGLTDGQRTAMGREIAGVAADDATVLLDCFAPRRRGPLPRGASRSDVEAAFPDWEITDIEVADTEPDAIARLLKFDEHFYRLRRAVTSGGETTRPRD
jgi:SAM-dependent methyltransferase